MSNSVPDIYHGVLHGRTIELDRAPQLPDGQGVVVAIQPAGTGEGVRESAGSWADAGPELDKWLGQLDAARHSGRSMRPA